MTFEIVLQNKHSISYALVTLIKVASDKEREKDTMKQRQYLSYTSHDKTIENRTKAQQKIEKLWYPAHVPPT